MNPNRRELLVYGLPAVSAACWLSRPALADDADAEAQKKADKEKSLQVMLGQAKEISVKAGTTPGVLECVLKESPLIHYSDQVRSLPDSSLWVWEYNGAPTLFCKIERIARSDGATKGWQYCCVPATGDKVDVTWGRDFRWRSREASLKWSPLTGAQPPRDQARLRLTQMKAMAREFSGRTEQTPTNSRQEMRLLSRPLHQYAAPDRNVVDGAVFGLNSNGTNPDALLLIEALREAESDSQWRFAVIGMTGDGVEVLHRQTKAWSKPYTDGPGDYRSWMWYVAAQ
jgi:hypothetical protein